MFPLADLIVGVQTAARASLCSLLFRYSQTEQDEGALAREDKPRIKIENAYALDSIKSGLHK